MLYFYMILLCHSHICWGSLYYEGNLMDIISAFHIDKALEVKEKEEEITRSSNCKGRSK